MTPGSSNLLLRIHPADTPAQLYVQRNDVGARLHPAALLVTASFPIKVNKPSVNL